MEVSAHSTLTHDSFADQFSSEDGDSSIDSETKSEIRM
jgi:hypothetical protein